MFADRIAKHVMEPTEGSARSNPTSEAFLPAMVWLVAPPHTFARPDPFLANPCTFPRPTLPHRCAMLAWQTVTLISRCGGLTGAACDPRLTLSYLEFLFLNLTRQLEFVPAFQKIVGVAMLPPHDKSPVCLLPHDEA